jgi:hypothetical protein
MLAQKCMYSFLDGKIRDQLVWFKCLTGQRVKLPHLQIRKLHKFDMKNTSVLQEIVHDRVSYHL